MTADTTADPLISYLIESDWNSVQKTGRHLTANEFEAAKKSFSDSKILSGQDAADAWQEYTESNPD